MHDVDMFRGPGDHRGGFIHRLLVDRRIEGAGKPPFCGEHFGIAKAELVQLRLGGVFPVGPALPAVDVKGESEGAGILQRPEEFLGERRAVWC